MPEATAELKDKPKAKAPTGESPQAIVNSDRTISAQIRVSNSGYYEEPDEESRNGYYQGRPIIGRDTPINGGVYLGGSQREAIVVDDIKSESLQRIYSDLMMETEQQRANGTFRPSALRIVYDKVLKELPYNEQQTNKIAQPFYNDRKVSLGVFIDQKSGVCKHQALLTAYLLEKLKKDGILGGIVSVDRNHVKGKGGHAWVRYTNSAGEVYIIDPAQGFTGRLSDIGPKDGRWFYQRTTDAK